MNRCLKQILLLQNASPRHLAAATAMALASLASLMAAPAAMAQTDVFEHSVPRTFPVSSLHGELAVTSSVEATVDGKPYRLAPGMRIFNQQNQLVFAHAVVGQKLLVRYLVEPSTGMLLTAWIQTKNELAKEPKKGWFK